MATIVTQNQNPSWGTVAVNLLAPLLTDALKRSQEANANRKMNAARAEFQKLLMQRQNDAQNPADTMPVLSSQPNYNDGWGRALNQNGGANINAWENALQGNNSNVWRDVFQNSNSAQNNNPTAWPTVNANSVLEPIPAGNNNIPTMADMVAAQAEILGNKRFSMLDPAQFQEMTAPYISAINSERQRQELKDLASNFTNAGNLGAKRDILASGAINNTIPIENFLKMISAYSPVQQQVNTGNASINNWLDAMTGDVINSQVYNQYLTPEQRATLNYKTQQLAQDDRQFGQKLAFDRWNMQQNNALRREELMEKARQFGLDLGLKERALDLDAERQIPAWDLQQINALSAQYQNAAKLAETLRTAYDNAEGEEKQKLRSELMNAQTMAGIYSERLQDYINNRGRQHTTQVMGAPSPKTPNVKNSENINDKVKQPINTIWGKFLGDDFDVSSGVSPLRILNGKARAHKGTDILAPVGTKITAPNISGLNDMKVAKVACDKGGYGKYVDVEGNYFGHKLTFRFAHLMDSDELKNLKAGDKLKAGDLIAQTGNTGRVSGKNGGYHLHLETYIDGKRTDPEKFFGDTGNFQKDFVNEQQKARADFYGNTFGNWRGEDNWFYNNDDTPIFWDGDGNVINHKYFQDETNRIFSLGGTLEDFLDILTANGYYRE